MREAFLQIAERSHTMRRVGANPHAALIALFVCVAYYLGTKLGFALTFQPHPISTLWPPNAILLAALLLTPPCLWWLPILAALPAHVAGEIQSGVPMAMVMGWFASNCSEALIGATAIRYLTGGEPLRFDSFRHVAAFMIGGALLGPFVSSFLDAGLVRLVGWGEGSYWELWRTRFFSNLLTEMTIVPAIVGWASWGFASLRSTPASRHVEAGLFALGLIAATAVAFGTQVVSLNTSPALLFAPLPFLIWAALRLGPLGTSTSLMLIVFLGIWGAIHGQGPFVQRSPMESALAIQLFLTVLAAPLLLLAAVLRERERAVLGQRRMEREAEDQRSRVTHLARIAILGELTGALAHELHQPLTAILATAQAGRIVLDEATVDLAQLREILGDIIAEDKRATEVIRGLRALLKRDEIQSEWFDVNALVREALGLAHDTLAQRGIVTSTRLAENLAPVRGNRVQLAQVLLNIILNACDEMGTTASGNRRLAIATELDAERSVRICVSDSGPGIDPQRLESLFESFFTTKPDGLGLGLSVSKSIVAAHGGRIRAENGPAGGAIFIVELPSSGAAESQGRGIGVER
jgi:signal transduction histidine kinase